MLHRVYFDRSQIWCSRLIATVKIVQEKSDLERLRMSDYPFTFCNIRTNPFAVLYCSYVKFELISLLYQKFIVKESNSL